MADSEVYTMAELTLFPTGPEISLLNMHVLPPFR
jgi:hypothetical protein